MIQDHVQKGYILSDLSSLMEQYIHVAENVELDEQDGGDGDNKDESGNNNNSGGSSKSDENKSQPSSTSFSGFSFASSSAPPPSSGGTTFSFTGGSTAAAPTAATVSKPTFSFGTQPAAQPAASGGSNNTTNEDDPTSNPDDGKLEVGQEENEDEEKLYEVLARLNKLEDNAWKKECKGPLRLYRNKTTDKKRMVLRNDAGRVMFNVAISNGMTFQKVSERTQKGKDIWFVQFFNIIPDCK